MIAIAASQCINLNEEEEMAEILEETDKECSSCHETRIVHRRWSCGCDTIIVYYQRYSILPGCCNNLFGCFLEHCGQEGNDLLKHKEKKEGGKRK